MLKIEHSLVINRPVEEVFEFMTDPEKTPQYESGLLESGLTSEGPVGVGTTYREVRQFLGKRMESINEVTEYEPNSKFGFKTSSGPIPVEGNVTFESVEGGTRVSVIGQGEAGGFFKLAESIVGRMARRQLVADYANLKDLLEAQD